METTQKEKRMRRAALKQAETAPSVGGGEVSHKAKAFKADGRQTVVRLDRGY